MTSTSGSSPPQPPPESRYRYLSHHESQHHPDFQTPWVKQLLSNPQIEFVPEIPEEWHETNIASNTLFNNTLAHADGLKARMLFCRPSAEPDAASGLEDCLLLSIGSGLDGMTGRAHGGLSSVILDHLLGTCSRREAPTPEGGNPPATATLTVDYKNPVLTPCVVLARAWMLQKSGGRKIWLKGVLEDGEGRLLATAKTLYVNPRDKAKAVL